MRIKGSQKTGLCVYCGETKLLTRDHVIAKYFFPKPLPSKMLTVAACEICQKEKKGLDEYLRDSTAIDIQASNNLLILRGRRSFADLPPDVRSGFASP